MSPVPDDQSPPPPLASPLRRLSGFMIDSVLYGLVLLAVLSFSDTNFDALTTGEETISNGVLLVGLLIFGVYQVAFTALRGQTIGKIVVRTKVIDAESGALPGWQSAFIRWGAPASLATIPWLGYLSVFMYAWLLRDKRRQGLHDKVARTLVIRVV